MLGYPDGLAVHSTSVTGKVLTGVGVSGTVLNTLVFLSPGHSSPPTNFGMAMMALAFGALSILTAVVGGATWVATREKKEPAVGGE